MSGCNFSKRYVRVGLVASLFACAVSIPTASAATEAKKVEAIHKGLAHLYATQQPGGYWNYSGYEQAATGAAAFALLNQRDKWGNDAAQYQAAVDKAVAYLVSTANITEVSTRNDGINICPSGAAACKAVYWFGNARSTQTSGLIASALATYGLIAGPDAVATTTGPLAGMTWGQIAQGIANAVAFSQSTGGNGSRAGGWGDLIPGTGDSNSTSTQWAVVSLIYSETLGAITPEATKDELRIWLDRVQSTSGAACSQPGAEACSQADTGGWLLAMRFIGREVSDSQVAAALTFLDAEWRPTSAESRGSFGQPQAMWSVYGGLATTIGLKDTTHIVHLLNDCGASANKRADQAARPSCTWAEDYSQWLVDNQKADGSWGGAAGIADPLAVAFSLNILGGVQIPVRATMAPDASTVQRSSTTPKAQNPSALPTAGQTISALSPTATIQDAPTATSTRKVRKRIRRGVTALAVSNDGGSIASAGTDKRILVFSPGTGIQRLALQGSLGLPTGLAYSPGGTLEQRSQGQFSPFLGWSDRTRTRETRWS